MGTKLTEREIDRLACPPGKRDCMVFDTEQRGLAVRVVATGSKSYLVSGDRVNPSGSDIRNPATPA